MTKPQFTPSLRLPQTTALVAGSIIGASIFVQPSEVASQLPSAPAILLAWLVAGVLSLFGALVCAELASAFTRTGGVYVYLQEAFSPSVGFLWGWTMFWVIHSGIIAAIALVSARYAVRLVGLSDGDDKMVATIVILLLTAVNLMGVREGSLLQSLFTLGKIVAIVAIVVCGFVLGPALPVETAPLDGGVGSHDFIAAVIAGIFAFGGWHMVTFNSEETVNSSRTIPRALILGMTIVVICYIALNAVYLHVLPFDVFVNSKHVAADAADAVLGSGGGAAMSGLVVFSTFGALAGIVLAGPRVYFAMARDGLLFRWLGELHPKYRTPRQALLLQGVWACTLVWTGTYRALFTRIIYLEWIFFALMAAGLILLRRRPDYSPSYRLPGYPFVPIVFILSAIAIAVSRAMSDPWGSATGLGLVLAGLPVYRYWKRQGEA